MKFIIMNKKIKRNFFFFLIYLESYSELIKMTENIF